MVKAEDIPQIKPAEVEPVVGENQPKLETEATASGPDPSAPEGGSILVPKQIKPQTITPTQPKPTDKRKMFKILAIVGIALAVFLVAIAVPSFVIYGKANKFKNNVLKLVDASKPKERAFIPRSASLGHRPKNER